MVGRREVWAGTSRRPWLVANRATLSQPCAAKLLAKRVPRTGLVPMHSITIDATQHLRLKLSPLLSATGQCSWYGFKEVGMGVRRFINPIPSGVCMGLRRVYRVEDQGWHGILGVEGITMHSITLDGTQHLRLKLSPLLPATGQCDPCALGLRSEGAGFGVEG